MSAPAPRDATTSARLELARSHLRAGRPLTLRAEGHSMWPLVKDGDLVVVSPIAGALVIGDVVLVALDGRLVLHRVIALTPEGCVTKGDATASRDAPVIDDDILGALPRASPIFNQWVAALSRRAPRTLAAALRRLRLAVAKLSL